MADVAKLEAEFNEDLDQILVKEKAVGLNSSRFRLMLIEHRGLKTAHLLLAPTWAPPANTFGYLREIGRPDLTLEYYVCLDKYQPLFTDEERQIAKFRLEFES